MIRITVAVRLILSTIYMIGCFMTVWLIRIVLTFWSIWSLSTIRLIRLWSSAVRMVWITATIQIWFIMIAKFVVRSLVTIGSPWVIVSAIWMIGSPPTVRFTRLTFFAVRMIRISIAIWLYNIMFTIFVIRRLITIWICIVGLALWNILSL